MADVKFAGQEIQMGERKLTLPPLNFKQLKDEGFRKKLSAMGTIGSEATTEQIDAARDAIYACLVRNYPDLSVDALEEMITMGNLRQCIRAMFGVEMMPGEAPVVAAPR